jgi:hypothetical protein
MRTLARIGLVAAFATVALIGGCNKGTRVEDSASKTATCSEGKAACSESKAACSEAKASSCCSASKDKAAAPAKQN